jgi:Response regulators consisting of a CheY-like receiver domain and a winged-helix DNA-binding domain
MRILLVENDPQLTSQIIAEMQQHQAIVVHYTSVEQAQANLMTAEFDAAIIELEPLSHHALELVAAIRQSSHTLPIIVITVLDDIESKLTALEQGADDYVIKPFSPSELATRLLVRLKNYQNKLSHLVTIGNLSVDLLLRRCHYQQREVHLTSNEWAILRQLALNANHSVSKELLEAACHGLDNHSNAIEVHIHHLRKKTDKNLIRTIRGLGYILTTNETVLAPDQ